MTSHATPRSCPLAVVTCGPAFEPLDRVRRISNFSTGEIGSILSRALLVAGCEVICFRGEGATFPVPSGVEVHPFSTNTSLASAIKSLPHEPTLIFHAAALCDFEVAGIEGASGERKLSSRSGELIVRLRPAEKILPHFREWFPGARIIGWKYELDGTRADVLEKAASQLSEARSDACVINGSAYGQGFGIVRPGAPIVECHNKEELAAALVAHFVR